MVLTNTRTGNDFTSGHSALKMGHFLSNFHKFKLTLNFKISINTQESRLADIVKKRMYKLMTGLESLEIDPPVCV